MENTISQLVKTITNELYNTIQWSLQKFPLREQHCATYWINDNYCVFADTTIYDKQLLIKIEKYDSNNECVDDEVDSELSKNLTYSEILKCVNNTLNYCCVDNKLIKL